MIFKQLLLQHNLHQTPNRFLVKICQNNSKVSGSIDMQNNQDKNMKMRKKFNDARYPIFYKCIVLNIWYKHRNKDEWNTIGSVEVSPSLEDISIK